MTHVTRKIDEGNMKRAYVEIPEGQMHFRFEGNGETIILLHMAVALSDEFSRAMHFLFP